MDEKTIHGEIARKCGNDHAFFGYWINTDTNGIEYYVDSFIGGEYKKRTFARYADARAHFDSL